MYNQTEITHKISKNNENTYCTPNYTLNYTILHKANLFNDYPTSDTKCEVAY